MSATTKSQIDSGKEANNILGNVGLYDDQYDPPSVLETIGALLQAPRKYHSTEFSDVFSSDKQVQLDYANGLLSVLVMIFVLYLIWILILVILKAKGSEVGCASGRPFFKENLDNRSHIESTDSEEDEEESEFQTISLDESKNEPHLKNLEEHIEKQMSGEGSTGFDSYGDYDSRDEWIPSVDSRSLRQRISKRERRTRLAFLLFCSSVLVCVPIILVFSFGPMKEATRTSDDLLLRARDAWSQVKASLRTISTASVNAEEIVNATTIELPEVCPLVDQNSFIDVLGIDLKELSSIMSIEFNELNSAVSKNISLFEGLLDRFDSGMDQLEETVNNVNNFMWLVPGLLFALSVQAAIAIFVVLLAWREKSSAWIQSSMSYIFLPILLVLSLGCWIVLMLSALGTMISSDICLAGSPASPENTVQNILTAHNYTQSDTVYKLMTVYTHGCVGSDPAEDIKDLEGKVQVAIDAIWRQISIVDSIGRNKLVDLCGSNELLGMLSGARNLAKLLTAVRRALDSAGSSLRCERINPIYEQAVHTSVCTEAASATAYGFIFFLILALSTMVMISLRASWLQDVMEEKVYHDESEVAENMILDEHEEYLAYISRYKHEWQEYRGFDCSLRASGEEDNDSFNDEEEQTTDSLYYEGARLGDDDSRVEGEGYNGSIECSSDDERSSIAGVFLPNTQISLLNINSGSSIADGAKDSIATDDISFLSLSLQDHHSDDESSIEGDDLFALPPPLLPPTSDKEYMNDDQLYVEVNLDMVEVSRSPQPLGITRLNHETPDLQAVQLAATAVSSVPKKPSIANRYGVDPTPKEYIKKDLVAEAITGRRCSRDPPTSGGLKADKHDPPGNDSSATGPRGHVKALELPVGSGARGRGGGSCYSSIHHVPQLSQKEDALGRVRKSRSAEERALSGQLRRTANVPGQQQEGTSYGPNKTARSMLRSKSLA